MTLTGQIATWVIAALIFAGFAYGLYHLYRNFRTGKSSCCVEGKSSSCSCCAAHHSCSTTGKSVLEHK